MTSIQNLDSLPPSIEIYLNILLIGLLIGVFVFLVYEKVIKKQKITINIDFFLILLFSVISFFIIFFLLALDIFMFVDILTYRPSEKYLGRSLLIIFTSQIIFFIIYRYKIKKIHFKPKDILLTACFILLTSLSTIIVAIIIVSSFWFIYEFSPSLHYLVIKVISFVLSIFIFEIGSRIFNKMKKDRVKTKNGLKHID